MPLTGTHNPGDTGHASDHNLIDQAFLSWKPFTPTLSGGTWALGNSTLACAYAQIGKTIHFRLHVTFGSTFVADATAPLQVSLPASMSAGQTACPLVLVGTVKQASSGTAYLVFFKGKPTDATVIVGDVATGSPATLAGITATTPISFVAGDEVRVNGTYEAA